MPSKILFKILFTALRQGFSDGAANTCGMEILCQERGNKNVINI